jgi:chromosome segregation ATPase
MQNQILNYEDVDETRRALIEHLLAERQTLLAEREGLADRTQRRIELVRRGNEELEARLSAAEEDASAIATQDLEEALDEERRRSDEIERKLQAVREAHDAARAEHRQLVSTLEQQIKAEQENAHEIQQRGQTDEHSERERAAELSRRVAQLRDELERSAGVDQEQIAPLQEELATARKTARTLALAAEKLNGKLEVVREAASRLRAKIKDGDLLASEPSRPAGERAKPPPPPPDSELEGDEEDAELAGGNRNEPVDADPREGSAEREEPEAAAEQADDAEMAAINGPMTLVQFRQAFEAGCRIVRSPSAQDSMLADDASRAIGNALDRTENSEEVVALVPLAVRRRLVESLFRMYGRGVIELADVD